MAESKRRGEEPEDDDIEDLDESFDDAVDDDADDDEDQPVSRGGTATRERRKTVEPADKPKAKKDPARVGLFGRLVRFFREVVAELRKVIWPGRRELITYTTVVIVFVAFIVALVAGLDLLFARGVIAVFG